MSPKKENPFLKDPGKDPEVQTIGNIEVMNAMSAVLLAHGDFHNKTVKELKKMFDDSGLRWWIIAAGVGAIVEALHIAWLALEWVVGRL
jgi:hypothetical protein